MRNAENADPYIISSCIEPPFVQPPWLRSIRHQRLGALYSSPAYARLSCQEHAETVPLSQPNFVLNP